MFSREHFFYRKVKPTLRGSIKYFSLFSNTQPYELLPGDDNANVINAPIRQDNLRPNHAVNRVSAVDI